MYFKKSVKANFGYLSTHLADSEADGSGCMANTHHTQTYRLWVHREREGGREREREGEREKRERQ